ncbi:MAG: GAF domain-containing protein [Anaerolineaceae bacterium]|nr:GAF domain-containing protein [Anaerolineaceae bacterium]MBN2678281.1 GAF domain-containing protein [Anaerolineaceae bacterium]
MLPDFRVRQRDYLLEITRALTGELDLTALLERILDISVEMLAGRAGFIALHAEPSWQVTASKNLSRAFRKHLERIITHISEREESAKIEIQEIMESIQRLTITASMGLLSGVGLPLMAQKKVIGVIFVFRNYAGVFSTNDRLLLRSFADQAAIAVVNAQLYTQISKEKKSLDILLDSAADGILILDPRHIIERVNATFAQMASTALSQIVGKRHDEIIQWDSPPQGIRLEEAEAGGWPLTPNSQLYVDGDLKRPNQNPLPVGISYVPLLSPEGHLMNIIMTVRDNTRYRQADDLKSTFISIISHELKTPVALIKGYVATLRRDDARWDKAVVNDSLAVIEDETDHLTSLIDNLLDASRLQTGGISIKRSDVNLKAITEQLAERYRTQSKHHEIIIDLPHEIPILLADEDRLRQVISNLLSNAIKYSPGGKIIIKGQVKHDQVIICISDEGPGIAQSDIQHIFDRFYRAPGAVKQTKGAGLGLYLARSIIEAHGGQIWVESHLEKGARFCFSLPRIQPE